MITPATLQMLLLVLMGRLERREREAIADLIEENRLLRRQLGGRRLRFTDEDDSLSLEVARPCGGYNSDHAHRERDTVVACLLRERLHIGDTHAQRGRILIKNSRILAQIRRGGMAEWSVAVVLTNG